MKVLKAALFGADVVITMILKENTKTKHSSTKTGYEENNNFKWMRIKCWLVTNTWWQSHPYLCTAGPA